MSLGLPIITHPSEVFNGHLEVVVYNGFVCQDYKEYADKMELLENDLGLKKTMGKKLIEKFEFHYDFESQMDNIIGIYEDVIKKPFPNKHRRKYLHCIQ